MSLEDILAVPEGEKAVLVVAEDHETDCIEPTLELIEAFKPDAIAVELRTDTLASRILELFSEFKVDSSTEVTITPQDKEVIGRFYDYTSCMVTSRVYAAKKELPLYYLDWYPFCPLHQQDVLSETPLSLPYRELKRCFSQTIDDLFWQGAAAEAYRKVSGRELNYIRNLFRKTMLKTIPLSRDEELAGIKWYALLGSQFGMTLRNEYTAMALNALEKKRILYVCGKYHTHPKIELRTFKGFTPLHHLIDAPHTFVADMEYACTEDGVASKLNSFAKRLNYELWHPKEIKKKKSLKLPWDTIRFYCPECHGG